MQTTNPSHIPINRASNSNIKYSILKEYNQLFNSNIDLVLYYGNVTQIPNVDAIVNSTGSHFQHSGGSSKAIVNASGQSILQEFENYLRQNNYLDYDKIFVCDSYDLKSFYKKILSIRSPDYSNYFTKRLANNCQQMDLIQHIFFNLINKSFIDLNLKSFATPLIGSGINRVPIQSCVNSLIESIKLFVNNVNTVQNSSVKRRIFIVDNNLDNLIDVSNIIDANFDILQPVISSLKPENTDKSVDDQSEKCVICMDTIGSEPNTFAKKLDKCGHSFCNTCIDNYFTNVKKQCPVCGTVYGLMYGSQPDGKMNYRTIKSSLPGFDKNSNTIEITYNFPGGIQAANHPNPGRPYSGTSRIAYLPGTPKGLKVLDLLKKSFELKQTFTIGTSRTTGTENTVTWNDIHHKTHISGGTSNFGYPDPTYLDRVIQELAAKGIF